VSLPSAVARLVDETRAGDVASFGRLYELHAPLVHGILLARVPRPEVEDLVQDVFLTALTRLGALRDPASFGPWIAAITRNRANDFFRRRRPGEELPAELAAPARLEGGLEASRALEAIRELPEAYRETLVLRLVEGMTGPEIAERTGLTPASVRVNLHRGLKLLRGRLGLEEES